MAAAAEPLSMTVEQYRQLPERTDVIRELHWGQVVALTPPKMSHTKVQHRLVELLRPRAQGLGVVAAAREFWVVDAKRRTVTVTAPGGGAVVYEAADRIPLMFGGELGVAEIVSR
jgi:Uma2 family endonuclease